MMVSFPLFLSRQTFPEIPQYATHATELGGYNAGMFSMVVPFPHTLDPFRSNDAYPRLLSGWSNSRSISYFKSILIEHNLPISFNVLLYSSLDWSDEIDLFSSCLIFLQK